MKILSDGSAWRQINSRQAGSGQPQAAGSSFQEQLARSAGREAGSAAEGPALPAAEASITSSQPQTLAPETNGGSLSSILYNAQFTMLERMKLGREKQEEEDAWNELMEYVDAWIETLQGEGDLERTSRAYAAVKAREAEEARPSTKRKEAADVILEQLSERLSG